MTPAVMIAGAFFVGVVVGGIAVGVVLSVIDICGEEDGRE